jgi:hypothetical protein
MKPEPLTDGRPAQSNIVEMEINLMRPRTTRSFRISDALVLVAATGIGLAGCRFWFWATQSGWGDLWALGDNPVLLGLWITASRATPISSIVLLSWTTAILLLRLLATPPCRRHLWRQPGFLACVAVVFVFAWKCIALGLLLATVVLMTDTAEPSQTDYVGLFSELAFIVLNPRFALQADVGAAVLLVWLVTWASGRFRPEPSWVDRSGRLLGVAWVGISLLAFHAMVV